MSSTLCLAEVRVVDSPVLTSEFAMRVDSQPNGGNFDLIHDLGPAMVKLVFSIMQNCIFYFDYDFGI